MERFETTEMAWLAADRAMLAARSVDDTICLARATRSVARAMAGLGQRQEAMDVLVAMANRMEPELGSGDRNLLSLYGMLLLPAAIAAAHDGDCDTALTMHGEAEKVARQLEPGYHDPVNIGNPQEWTIRQFAEKIREITGSNSQIAYKPLPVDDPKVHQPDITRARKLLGWEPKVSVDAGIRETIDYFRGKLAPARSAAPATLV